MAKKGVKYNCPKKVLHIPKDWIPLHGYAATLIQQLVNEHKARLARCAD